MIYGFSSVDVALWSDLSRGNPVTDWAQRIGRHITTEGSVIVPPRIACWLEQKAGMTADRRISLRDNDPLAYEVLAALRIAALSHGAGIGTKDAAGHEETKESE